MAKMERYRETVDHLPTEAELRHRLDEGWKPVAIEWQRRAGTGHGRVLHTAEIPYGLEPAADGGTLQENPDEVEVMITMLELIVQDAPLSRVATELTRRGLACRDGSEWTQTRVFQLLPRLVEVGPEIYASDRWAELRKLRSRAGLMAAGDVA